MSTTTTKPHAQVIEPDQQVIEAVEYFILVVLACVILIFHSYKTYQDFCTPGRDSVSFRRQQPPITPGYKRISLLTYCTILMFGMAFFASMISRNFSQASSGSACVAIELFTLCAYFIGKILMYNTFVLRLHEVYGNSASGYGKRKLICASITVILMFGSAFIIGAIVFAMGFDRIVDADDKYPYYCATVPTGEDGTAIFGAIFFLSEIVASIASICSFVIPLNRTIKAVKQHSDRDSNDKRFAKMIYAGTKYKIIVLAASISTLLWIIFVIIPDLFIVASVLSAADPLINIVCLVLMTAYYPDDLYYQKLCYLCILCCDRGKQSYQSKASAKHRTDDEKNLELEVSKPNSSVRTDESTNVPPSVDTGDAVMQTVEDNSKLSN